MTSTNTDMSQPLQQSQENWNLYIKAVMAEVIDQVKDSLRPEFIELEPGFLPKQANPKDAGADLKMVATVEYDTHKLTEELWSAIRALHTPDYTVFINGQKIDERQNAENIIDDACKTVFKLKSTEKLLVIKPEPKIYVVGTGFKIALPELMSPFLAEYQIRSRSGLGFKLLNVINRPGTIDSKRK